MNTGEAATRTVVSGVGVVSPIGIGNPAFWASLAEGRSGVTELGAESPVRVGAKVTDFDAATLLPRKKFLKVMSRDIQLGVAAARLAVKDAGLKRGQVNPERLGVVFGAGRMSPLPCELGESIAKFARCGEPFHPERWTERDLRKIAPLWLLRQLPNMPAAHVSMAFDARGPNNTITSRDASTLLAVTEAVNMIERDSVDCVIVGGCGSLLQPVDQTKLSLYETLSQNEGDPADICRPFDKHRDGTVLGEGAAAFVLERDAHFRNRQAAGYAEILGIGAGCDAARGTPGIGLVHAITAAVSASGLSPHQPGAHQCPRIVHAAR